MLWISDMNNAILIVNKTFCCVKHGGTLSLTLHPCFLTANDSCSALFAVTSRIVKVSLNNGFKLQQHQ